MSRAEEVALGGISTLINTLVWASTCLILCPHLPLLWIHLRLFAWFSIRWNVHVYAELFAYLSVFFVFFSCCLHLLSGFLHSPCSLPSLPSDRLAQCQERMFVFESCQDVTRVSSTRGHVGTRLAISSKVRGNMTSQSGLISDWLWSIKGMDRSYFIDVDPFFIHSAPEGNVLCPSIVQIIDKIYDSVD